MLDEYEEVYKKLGDTIAPDNAARIMFGLLNHKD
jgi:lipid-A-disaccharide synthase